MIHEPHSWTCSTTNSRSFGGLVLLQSCLEKERGSVLRPTPESSSSLRRPRVRQTRRERGRLRRLDVSWEQERRACEWCGRDPNDGAHSVEQRGDATTKQVNWFRIC